MSLVETHIKLIMGFIHEEIRRAWLSGPGVVFNLCLNNIFFYLYYLLCIFNSKCYKCISVSLRMCTLLFRPVSDAVHRHWCHLIPDHFFSAGQDGPIIFVCDYRIMRYFNGNFLEFTVADFCLIIMCYSL